MLHSARAFALSGRFQDLTATCRILVRDFRKDEQVLQETGGLLLNAGYLTDAADCFKQAQSLTPKDIASQINLANVCREMGLHAETRRRYAALLEQAPHHPVVRRNALVCQEYDGEIGDDARLIQAKTWGAWAIAQAGGARPRPAMSALTHRRLRIGYVSADFCQHTVGLFVKEVLARHEPERITVFAYSAGPVDDWVTATIRRYCKFIDVRHLDDQRLAEKIRVDQIDVLVDLSGHTAGSKLTVFAHRPAPVQVSWLGYFATTGLSTLDAVLLDEWHAPPGIETQFVEPILRLSGGRFCYQPVPWAPFDVAPPPFEENGYITFGCFNNTAKLNDGVFDVWAKVLTAVPNSRLLLKWRTFNDEPLCQSIQTAFCERGIEAERVELRGPSFHADLLKEYGDIDIALDPFPFTGGLTSCESLWMGVPVVTWPQGRVVSRQTYAFLCAIGLAELAAQDAEDYVRIAASLAGDRQRLIDLRRSLRQRMRDSSLMDVTGFTRNLEGILVSLYRSIEAQEKQKIMTSKTILHVGTGHRDNGAKLPAAFRSSGWTELRLDIDPCNEPDIIGSMQEMSAVADNSIDAIYSAHNIEHVYAHEVPVVLKEFLRVLKPEGYAVITCPDLQSVCAWVAEDKLTEAAYQSPAGPITPLDILYGHGAALAAGHEYMAHKSGFTLKSLTQALQSAGFRTIAGRRRESALDLWVVATKAPMEEGAVRELAEGIFPT
ncbi:conserved protein of unknown function [Denitratisoma oestradiolicum]|uniref:protein O-GlcNAc transferase n=1 Tax=Denitratisoma oestradiolicum TaxID=311182 RepID=A0A6S6YU81_9PROT|nr:conserved protein of unknown function [Denitratisoma oestradiolicum]